MFDEIRRIVNLILVHGTLQVYVVAIFSGELIVVAMVVA